VQLAREQQLEPDVGELRSFVGIPFYALLLMPLAWLPLETAFRIWIALQIVLLIGSRWWAFRRWGPDGLILLPVGAAVPLVRARLGGVAAGGTPRLRLRHRAARIALGLPQVAAMYRRTDSCARLREEMA
jgi:Glycosyltransferase family 87